MATRKASSATRQAKKTSVQEPGKQANVPRSSIAGSRRDELVEAILATLPPPQPQRPMTADEAAFVTFVRDLHLPSPRHSRWRVDNPAGRDDYPVGLAAKLEQIGCQPEEVEGYRQSEKRVLASMYLEAERPHPSSLRLRQLAMRYALDARKPINDDLTRFKWNHTDDGLIITNTNSSTEAAKWNELTNEQSKNDPDDLWEDTGPEAYVPVAWPGVHITDLHSQHVLSLASQKSLPSTEIMDWIESRLGKVPTQDDALPPERPSESAFQNDGTPLPSESASVSPPATNANEKFIWLAKAMLLVQAHPDWSDAKIARKVDKNASTLSRSKQYKAAAAMARGNKRDLPQGFITVDPSSGLRDVEAVTTECGHADDKAGRGQPIPGSKLFLEYCAECGDQMRVTRDKVDTKPVCKSCST